MDAPNNPVFWRPRADLIRECVAAGLTSQEIKARCLAEGYVVADKSFRQSVYSARKSDGIPVPSRPSYYALWKQFLDEYDSAYRAGKLLVITREMKELIDTAQACLLQEQTREPFTARRGKRKKKRQ